MTPETEEQPHSDVVEDIVQPSDLVAPKGASAFARALYRKLASALDSGRDEDCFNMVQQLLREAPQDMILQKLARQLGRNLYKAEAAQLPEVLASGNVGLITQSVRKLRQMASEEELSGLVGYRDAASLVDASEKKRWQSMLLSALGKLRDATDLRAKEDMAINIEIYAREKRLDFTPEQVALITRVHEDWSRFCRAEKLRAEYARQLDMFRATEQKVLLRQDLRKAEIDLHERFKAVSEIAELPEAEDLLALIEKQQKKVRGILVARHRRKIIIRSTICVVLTVVFLAIATIVFTYLRADSLRNSIVSGMQEKQVLAVSDLVGGIDPMRGFYKTVHSGYVEALEQADAWLKIYNGYQAEIAEITPALSEATDLLGKQDVTAAQLTGGLVLVDKVRRVEARLLEEYNSTAPEEPTVLMKKFNDRLSEIRPGVLARFRQPTPADGMEEIRALYAEFLLCSDVLQVTEDEAAAVRRAIQDAVAERLHRMSRLSLDPRQAEAALAEYDKYAESLPLQPALRSELAAYAAQTRKFDSLPDTLRSVSSLEEFAATIEACGDCYKSVDSAVTPEEVRALCGTEDAAMRAYKLADFAAAAEHALEPAQILPSLQAVRSIYAEGSSVYTLARPERMDKLIGRMLSDRNNAWSNGLMCARQDSSVYVGSVSGSGERRVMTLANGQGRPSRRRVNLRAAAVAELQPVVLAGQRAAMGFEEPALMEGKVTPARLMMNVARHAEKNCPAQARAYMFGFAVQMAEALDPYSSGLAFSESLRADIAAYKAMLASNPIYPGCWYVMHGIAVDNRWLEFFSQVAAHDYYAEILNAVLPITDSTCTYAGYVSASGQTVRCREGNEQLYILKDGVINPYEGTPERPYTPLFVITLPQR